MIRSEPPEKERAGSEWRSNPAQQNQKHKKDTGRITDGPTPIKRLLANWGTTWSFQVEFPKGTKYWVEQGEKRWEFSLRYSAEAKFTRLARQEGYQE